MHDRGSWDMVKVAAVAAVLFVGFYVGAYYWLVRAEGIWTANAAYSWNDEPSPRLTRIAAPLFWPMNWLDRRIRPDFWEREDPPLFW